MIRIDSQVSYNKMKNVFGVKTFKACDKIFEEKYGNILDEMVICDYCGYVLWEDSETDYKSHKWGFSMHFKTDEANYNKFKDMLKDILEHISMEEVK